MVLEHGNAGEAARLIPERWAAKLGWLSQPLASCLGLYPIIALHGLDAPVLVRKMIASVL